MAALERYIRPSLLSKFEFQNYGHALELNDIFRQLQDAAGKSLISKYGASTTWMGKLEYRLKSRRNGGCPILAIGIKKPCVEGY